MAEPEAPGTWVYAASLPVTLVCLVLANVIIAYLGEWANVGARNPAIVAVAFVQGLAGAVMAGFASRAFFKSLIPADFWLKWIVRLAVAAFVVALVWILVIGKSGQALTWATLAGVTALIGTEIGRRLMMSRFAGPGHDEVAGSPS